MHVVPVTLSWGETKVPDRQASMHRKDPGRQPVHWSWLTVDATLKFGILHEVHFAPQATERNQNLG